MANETIEVERISDLAEGQYSDDSWLVIDTGTVVVKLKLKDAVPDASTEVKGKVQLSDSTNSDLSHVAATSKAVKSVMDALTQASEALFEAISGKYSKPSSGIPKSDLDSSVQKSLDNGDTALSTLQSIGKPLVWHGPADVATLNGTISGLEEGWTYTLTDAGTLTDGGVEVEVGDEVAWTGTAWFKVGGDSGKITVFTGYSNPGGTSLPSPEDVIAACEAGKTIFLQMQVQSNLVLYVMVEAALGSAPVGDEVYLFRNLRYANGRYYRLQKVDDTWTWDYYTTSEMPYSVAVATDYSNLTFPIAEGTACMHDGLRYVANADISTSESWTAAHWDQTSVEDTIGNVETLLAAL